MRNKKELIALLLLPLVVIGIMMFVIQGASVQKPVVAIVNQDNGLLGQRLVGQLRSNPGAEFTNLTDEEYRKAVRDNDASLAIIVPADFTSTIENGGKVEVEVYAMEKSVTTEGWRQNVNQYLLTMYAAGKTADRIVSETGEERSAVVNSLLDQVEQGSLRADYKLVGSDDTAEERQALTSIIGFALIFIMLLVFTVMGTIMEDKKRLTLARMFVSPAKQWEIAVGNLLGGLVLGIIQLVPLLLVLKFVFDLPWGREFFGLFLILFCFLLTTIGLGIGLAGLIKANFNPTVIIATVIVPTSILGGVFIPDAMLPEIMSRLGYAVPQKWVMRAIQSVLSGADIRSILLDLGIVLMFGLVFATFGAKALRPLND